MRKITKRSAAILAATAVAVGGGATAWAAGWFTGTGSATASSATAQPVRAWATLTPGEKLWPGQKRTANLAVTNNNDYPVQITNATDVTVTVAGNAGDCKNPDIKLGNVPNDVVIAPKTVATGTTPNITPWAEFIQMGQDAELACANKTFVIEFKLDGKLV
jgi:hypothetical protein